MWRPRLVCSDPLRWTEFPDVDSFVEFSYDSHGYGKPLVQLGIIDNSDKDNKQGNQDRDRWASKVRRLSVYGPIETCSIMLFGDIERNSPATLLGQPVGSRVWRSEERRVGKD